METPQPSWATCSRVQLLSRWKVFPDIQMEYSVFQFVPIVSAPVTRQRWKEPGSMLLAPSLQKCISVSEILCAFSRVKSPTLSAVLTAEMLQFLYHLPASSMDSLHVSLAPGSLDLDTELQWSHKWWVKRKGHTSLGVLTILIQHSSSFTFFVAGVHGSFMFSLFFTRTPKSFSSKLSIFLFMKHLFSQVVFPLQGMEGNR